MSDFSEDERMRWKMRSAKTLRQKTGVGQRVIMNGYNMVLNHGVQGGRDIKLGIDRILLLLEILASIVDFHFHQSESMNQTTASFSGHVSSPLQSLSNYIISHEHGHGMNCE